MKPVISLMLLASVVLLTEARHIQLKTDDQDQMMIEVDQPVEVLDNGNEIETINLLKSLKPSWFVPINSVLTFRSFVPCQDGFKRDLLGICREVWD